MSEMAGARVSRRARSATTSGGRRRGRHASGRHRDGHGTCQDLMDGGVESFHFYTLNRSSATREILRQPRPRHSLIHCPQRCVHECEKDEQHQRSATGPHRDPSWDAAILLPAPFGARPPGCVSPARKFSPSPAHHDRDDTPATTTTGNPTRVMVSAMTDSANATHTNENTMAPTTRCRR